MAALKPLAPLALLSGLFNLIAGTWMLA